MRLVRKAISKRARFRVLSRSGFRCVYCGACASEKRIDVDHVVPVSKGGAGCRTTPEEFKRVLLRRTYIFKPILKERIP